jgi:hypothetical protein
MRKYGIGVLGVVLVALMIGLVFSQSSTATAQDAEDEQEMEMDEQMANGHTIYEVTATNPRRNRKVLGEVTDSVQGVPAAPVHAFVWDGDGSDPVEGTAHLEIDPVANTGTIRAEWVDEHGHWGLTQTAFAPPPHPSGLHIGVGADTTALIEDDPVPTNVYLHGDTTAGEPVLPTVFNLLATWGPAEVTLNGEPFENPYDGPAPMWVAHTMVTEGVRNEDGTVGTVDGGIFNPMENPANGAVDPHDREFHVVFHDAPGPETDNFPPPLSFFYHVTFEDVTLEINHTE